MTRSVEKELRKQNLDEKTVADLKKRIAEDLKNDGDDDEDAAPKKIVRRTASPRALASTAKRLHRLLHEQQ